MWRKFLIVVLILFSREGASKRLFNIENLQNSSYLQLFSLYQAKQVEQQEKHEPSQQHQDINDKNQLLEFEYVSNLLQQKDYLMKEYRSLHVPQVSPIMSVTNDQTTYSTIYQDYILTKKSFKGKLKSEATKSGSNSAASVSISLSDCVQQDQKMELDAITNDYSLKNCNSMELNKIIPIPNIAYNSYTVRFKQNEELMEDLILNLTDHWPTILPLDDNELRPIETCPLNMHMILWGASDDVIARVFNTEVASSSFSPKFGKSVAHYFEYSRNGYSHSSLPPYAETIIQPGEYLFIPNNQLVSLQTKGEPDGEKKEKSLLKLCFFDASNVNDVRNSLKIESYISRSSADFLKQLNSPSSFDFTMIREPPADIVVDQYLVFPKPVVSTESKRTEHQELSGNRRYRGKSDYKDWQENTKWNFLIASLTIPQPPVPALAYLGRKNITLEWMTPYLPSDEDQTKFGVNITICLASALAMAEPGSISPSSSINDEMIDGCKVYSFDSKVLKKIVDIAASATIDSSVVYFQADVLGLTPQTSYQVRMAILYGEAGSAPSPWTSVFVTRPLAAPSPPIGPLIATPSNEFPTRAFLSFIIPEDDGGLPLLGYHVFARSTEEHHHSEWNWNGIYHNNSSPSTNTIVLEVKSLLADTSYQFQVLCFNEIGNSSFSMISNEIQTLSKGSPSTLVGLNHEDRFHSIPYHDAITKCNTDSKCTLSNKQPIPKKHTIARYPLTTIDDNAQTLTLYDLATEQNVIFEVWDCHWSPRLFQVQGQLAWSIPPLANEPMLFGLTTRINIDKGINEEYTSLNGKIALVQRGDIPIVFKILTLQKHGALACILLDPENCVEFNQSCIPGSQKIHNDRFASSDLSSAWQRVKIPILLLKSGDIPEFIRISGLNTYEELQEIIQMEKLKAAENQEEL